ncbi:hypothetical protein FRC02_000571 [Tulasnella sp. 418]|nr:hypothetical protein FRC02_000571 [Tulasnella sp. 418]
MSSTRITNQTDKDLRAVDEATQAFAAMSTLSSTGITPIPYNPDIYGPSGGFGVEESETEEDIATITSPQLAGHRFGSIHSPGAKNANQFTFGSFRINNQASESSSDIPRVSSRMEQMDIDSAPSPKKLASQNVPQNPKATKSAGGPHVLQYMNVPKPPKGCVWQLTEEGYLMAVPSGQQAPVARSNKVKIATPEKYDGKKAEDFDVKWAAIVNYVKLQKLDHEREEIALAISYLNGDAAKWALPILKDQNQPLPIMVESISWVDFEQAVIQMFDQVDRSGDALLKMQKLKQGEKKITAFTAEFNSIVRSIKGWNDTANRDAYWQKISREI